MLSITGSIVCQFYVTFTSVCVCICSCLFFMKSLTHDFDYIDNFVTFLFYVGRSHHLQEKKTTSKINNLNRVLQALHVIEYMFDASLH